VGSRCEFSPLPLTTALPVSSSGARRDLPPPSKKRKGNEKGRRKGKRKGRRARRGLGLSSPSSFGLGWSETVRFTSWNQCACPPLSCHCTAPSYLGWPWPFASSTRGLGTVAAPSGTQAKGGAALPCYPSLLSPPPPPPTAHGDLHTLLALGPCPRPCCPSCPACLLPALSLPAPCVCLPCQSLRRAPSHPPPPPFLEG